MTPRILSALAVAGLALLAPPQARAEDGIFGNILSRFSQPSEPKRVENVDLRDRDRETRNLRREYWERERARLAQPGLAREISNREAASRAIATR
jgi:hypothetical protein